MSIRMTGMMSGLDTDSIIKELMSAQSIKKTKIENKKTKLEWTMDRWKAMNSKIYGLYTGSLNKVKTAGNYQAKKVTSSNEAIVTATGSSTAAAGSHTIEISQLASAQKVTGKKLSTAATNSTKLTDLGFSNGETIKISAGTGSDAVTKTLTVGSSTTVKQFVDTLKSAGLNANFDEGQQRFFISSKDSGADSKFTMETYKYGDMDAVGIAKTGLLAAVGAENENAVNDFYNNYTTAKDTLKEKKTYYDSVKGNNSITTDERVKAYDEWKAAEKKVNDLKENLASIPENAYRAQVTATAQDEVKQAYVDTIKADTTSDVHKAIVDAVDKMYYLHNPDGTIQDPRIFQPEILESADAQIKSEKREQAINEINDLIANGTFPENGDKQQAIENRYNQLYQAEVGTTEESKKEALKIKAEEMHTASKESGFDSAGDSYLSTTEGSTRVKDKVDAQDTVIKSKGTAVKDAIGAYDNAILNSGIGSGSSPTPTTSLFNLGLANITLGSGGSIVIDNPPAAPTDSTNKFQCQAAQDAKINFDGAALTSTNNNFTAAGITFDIKGKSTGSITLNVSNNTEDSYNMIKDFVKSYNEVLTEMATAYYATSAKGYDPLTSDQKKAMSDDEIEEWNKKIQDSLLRRDDTLGALMESMRSALQTTVTVDGKRYSLSSFGITTSDDWTERGILHILGDKDDTYLPGVDNKLQKALEEDPELVGKVLSGVTNNLYETLQKKMATSKISSALTFYNDKQMKKQVDSFKDDIKTWEEKLQDMEDRYYKQFSAMETALAKLNSQSSALSGLMGS